MPRPAAIRFASLVSLALASACLATPARAWFATAAVVRASARAGTWLDTLAVDADTLTAHGVKGRKKLAEILDAEWMRLRIEPGGAARERILERVRALAAQTTRPSYHALAAAPGSEWREQGMSYLRVAWLLERFGLDTAAYRDSIAALAPRFAASAATRGPWQRRELERYAAAFGLGRDTGAVEPAVPGGVIARRLPAGAFDLDLAYDLTHEVFVRAEDPAGAPARWSPAERAYLARVLPDLAARAFAHHAADIGAELLTAMAECGLTDRPGFADGIRELLASQDAAGWWGSVPRAVAVRDRWVEQRVVLHTTMVALEALAAALGHGAAAAR